MRVSVVNFSKRIVQVGESQSANRRSHLENGRGRAGDKKKWEEQSDRNPEPQVIPSNAVPDMLLDRMTLGFIVCFRQAPSSLEPVGQSERISLLAFALCGQIVSNRWPT